MKSILILGASGYIGRNLTLNLLKSFKVVSIKFGSGKYMENIVKNKNFFFLNIITRIENY